ncbi:MAG TPA: DUF3108 domain-containing protein [Gemmatimonadaceae bacterium]
MTRRQFDRVLAKALPLPAPRLARVRLGLVLAVLTALTLFAVRAEAQGAPRFAAGDAVSLAPASYAMAPVPFAVGEQLTYKVHFGGIPAGTARMTVANIETVRGRPAYHVVFTIEGGIPFYRVRDRYESWIDVQTLASLRHVQQIAEGGYKRHTTYEIYPERAQYRKNDEPLQPSVHQPLDDGSFIYAVRAAGLRVGEVRRDDRYFRPDRNPVVLAGVGTETVKVGAGRFASTVVKPSIRANGLFSENGDAQIWFSDDANRYPVQVKTKFSKFSLTLTLQDVVEGDRLAQEQRVAALVADR